MKLISSSMLRAGTLAALMLAGQGSAHAQDIFDVSGTMMGGAQFASYSFEIADTAPAYSASLLDYAFPASFDFLSLAIVRGADLLGMVTGSGSFNFSVMDTGTYTALVFGDPGGVFDAGSYGISVTASVPEVQTWGMLAAGLWLVGLVTYRRSRKELLLGNIR